MLLRGHQRDCMPQSEVMPAIILENRHHLLCAAMLSHRPCRPGWMSTVLLENGYSTGRTHRRVGAGGGWPAGREHWLPAVEALHCSSGVNQRDDVRVGLIISKVFRPKRRHAGRMDRIGSSLHWIISA